MKGRVVLAIVLPLLVVALVAQVRDAQRRFKANRIVAAVETMTLLARERGGLPPRMGAGHLRLLREAAALDPALVDVLVARGWQYLEMNKPESAVRTFEEALALEPRAEVYANLGQAYTLADDHAAARRAFDRAIALDPRMEEGLRTFLGRLRP